MRVRIHFSKGFFPLLFSSLLIILCLAGCAENSSMLDNGQSRQLEFLVSTYGWKNSDKSSDQKIPSRATPISTFNTSNSFNVIADINKGGNWTTEVNNEPVSYSTANHIWQTYDTHYWPGTNSTVNFYAYYPTSILNNITHTSGSAPFLSYTVPDNVANQIDILASSKTGIAGDSYNQTPVDFKHIFAAVQFQVGSLGLPSGTISSISIGNVANSGTYNFGSGWSNVTGSKIFTISPSTTINGTPGEGITSGIYTFLMIPQIFSNVTITLSYSNGTTFSTVISGTWTAGNIYTYQLSKSIVYNFDYTGDTQTFTAPYTGTYKIQCWGAGSSCQGAYASGELHVNKNNILYIYVGAGLSGCDIYRTLTHSVVYNGGGGFTTGCPDFNNNTGGGATDIRLTDGNWDDFSSLKSRIMVAAGGSGSVGPITLPGYGGALVSKTADGAYPYETWPDDFAQVSGVSQESGYSFGTGQSGGRAGGGGGYYGGYAEKCAGSGGSSFISGYPGCNAISESSTSTNIIHTGSPNHYSGYVFTNMEMIAGDSSMPSPSSGTEIGYSGNGYARITFVSAN